jgi:hypothetical protein
MTKKKTEQSSKLSAAKVEPARVFPGLSFKENLECRVLLEDQILLIDVRRGISCWFEFTFWKLFN